MTDRNIITRREAQITRRGRYFTGEPCARGHICERFVGRSWCVECAKEGFKPDGKPNKYLGSEPCENGHVGWRYMNGACLECGRELSRRQADARVRVCGAP